MASRVAPRYLQIAPIASVRPHLVVLIFFVLSIIIIFGIALSERVYSGGDYAFRAENALNWLDPDVGRRPGPHFLTEMSFLVMYLGLPRVDIETAALIAMLTYFVFLGLLLYYLLYQVTRRSVLSAVLALSLMVVTPITIFTWPIMNLNYGYIGITMYHNPTINVLKPFAVVLFGFAASAFMQPARTNLLRVILICSIVTILSAVAKPNFIICLFPALSLFFAYKFVRGEAFDWRLLLFGILIPSALIILAQYLITYEVDDNGVAIAPFYAMSLYPKSGDLIVKFVLSILFPLTVYALYFRRAKQDTVLNLAWLTFFVGAAFTYLFTETGRRQDDGNFIWSGQITLFILFVQSMVFFLRENISLPSAASTLTTRRAFICWIVFGLHLASGILWWAVYAGESTLGIQPNIWR
jgi:hypothetical protein